MKNLKYKTALCRYFTNDKPCPMGSRCHFSHGRDELRRKNDPLPVDAPVVAAGRKEEGERRAPASNFKTLVCKYWEQGQCKYGNNCSFAHGEMEVRTNDIPTVGANVTLENTDPLQVPVFEYSLRIAQFEHLCAAILKLHIGSEAAAEAQSVVARVRAALAQRDVNRAGDELMRFLYAPRDAQLTRAHQTLVEDAISIARHKLATVSSLGLKEEVFALMRAPPMRDYFEEEK